MSDQILQAELLDQLEQLARAATPGPWKRSERPNGPFWHISSEYTVGGERCKSGRQAIGSVHAASKRDTPGYAAMFQANADFIAAANPEAVLRLIELARRSANAGHLGDKKARRTEFEAWARGQECDLTRTEAGSYADNETQTGWDAWQAARRSTTSIQQGETVTLNGRVHTAAKVKQRILDLDAENAALHEQHDRAAAHIAKLEAQLAGQQGDEMPPLPVYIYGVDGSLIQEGTAHGYGEPGEYVKAEHAREYGASCRASRAADARDAAAEDAQREVDRKAIIDALSTHRMVHMHEVEDDGSLGNSYPLIDRLCLDDGRDIASGKDEVEAIADAVLDAIDAARSQPGGKE